MSAAIRRHRTCAPDIASHFRHLPIDRFIQGRSHSREGGFGYEGMETIRTGFRQVF
jgi:hypothetical protein